jgi:hypothetical protein
MMREWVTRPVSRAGILCCLVASAVAAAAATATVSNFIPSAFRRGAVRTNEFSFSH